MKLRAWRCVFMFSAAAVAVLAQTSPGVVSTDKVEKSPAPATPPAPAKTPAKSAPAKTDVKKEEPMGKIEGIEIKRGSGYLGIALDGGTFKLSFYNSKKKPVAADVSRAALRWPVSYRQGDERTVLNVSGDGKSLTSPKVVKAPHNFKLFITLLPGEGGEETASESYVVDFRG